MQRDRLNLLLISFYFAENLQFNTENGGVIENEKLQLELWVLE